MPGIESSILQACLVYLSYKPEVYWIRNNSGAAQTIRHGRPGGYIQFGKKGSPDIVICHNGQYIGLEVKSPTGHQSGDQKQAEADIRKAGGLYYIIRSVDELQRIIEG